MGLGGGEGEEETKLRQHIQSRIYSIISRSSNRSFDDIRLHQLARAIEHALWSSSSSKRVPVTWLKRLNWCSLSLQEEYASESKLEEYSRALLKQWATNHSNVASTTHAAPPRLSQDHQQQTQQQQEQQQQRQQQQRQQQRISSLLTWLVHAQSCEGQESCVVNNPTDCTKMKKLLKHLSLECNEQCRETHTSCRVAHGALKHYNSCRDPHCQLCSGARRLQLSMPLQQAQPQHLQQQHAQPRSDDLPHEDTEAEADRTKTRSDHSSANGMTHGAEKRKRGAENPESHEMQSNGMNTFVDVRNTVSSKMEERRDATDGEAEVTNDESSDAEGGGIEGSSLIETLSADEIHRHLARLRQAADAYKSDVQNSQQSKNHEDTESQARCLACGLGSLKFEPPAIFCFRCNNRIKKNQKYYELTMTGAGTKHFFCHDCLQKIPGDSIDVENVQVSKKELKMHVNQQNEEEPWVECSECKYWLHQICALFNQKINASNSKFTCPHCILEQLNSGKRKPVPIEQSPRSFYPASKLPTTEVSDFLEEWINDATVRERHERAQEAGLSPENVAKAGKFTVRVVNCRWKWLRTQDKFYEVFARHKFPHGFRYREKAVLLFQCIDGVDVCMFAMYVQEYGANQPKPNNRRVYISYVDSVKYFEPEVKTKEKDALRTYVYHHLIIGYLKHCKQRGFVTCNIWACPPQRGEDYIFYCHPNRQRIPSNEKLREWYHKLLQRARQYNIVVHLDNMYDKFKMGDFEQMHSATSLPYFEGDFFATVAETSLKEMAKKEQDGGGAAWKSIGSRKRGYKLNNRLKGNKIKDGTLVYKLGEKIKDTKADFMLVYLQHECSHCMRPISGMHRYYTCQSNSTRSHSGDEDVTYCADCVMAHPELKAGMQYEWIEPLSETADRDQDIVNECFDTRRDFLKLCMGYFYQFDTLRRAKHSSMMVLHYLHNPEEQESTATFTCNVCNQTIEHGTGARCKVCTDFDVCRSCYAHCSHEHPLVLTNRRGDNEGVQKILSVIDHAYVCSQLHCGVEKCTRVKRAFKHACGGCDVKAAGGCNLCKEYEQLLHLHVRHCGDPECSIPGCQRQQHFRRTVQQQEDQRRVEQYVSKKVAAAT